MPALIESTDNLVYVRERPWHGLGVQLNYVPDSKTALISAGLDWKVERKDVFVGGNLVEGYKANVRDKDGIILGIVSDKYKVVNNEDAFAFVDNLVDGSNTRYETAGSLRNGKTVWMLAKMPDEKILGDDIEQYLCFTNTHDGTGSVKVFFTPIRVVCANTLSAAIEGAPRSWYATHSGNIQGKLHEAKDTLFKAQLAMDALKNDAEELVKKKLSTLQIAELINQLFPEVDPSMTDRQKENNLLMKEKFIECLNMDDLQNFKGTGWGFVNAAADYAAHHGVTSRSPYNESRFGKVIFDNKLLNKARKLVIAA